MKRDWIDGIAGDRFFQRVQQCVARIQAHTVMAMEQGVLIAEQDASQFTAAFFAAVHVGVPVILANPKWRTAEWNQLGQQVSPALVFGQVPIPEATHSLVNRLQPGTILVPTGGSSGTLKLAIHTWDTLNAACEGLLAFMGSGPIHSCCMLPLYHVSGLMQLVRSFVSAGRIIFTELKSLQNGEFPEFATDELCVSLVPTQLRRMIEAPRVVDWLRGIRAIFLGGAVLSSDLAARIRTLQLPIVPVYGMTETAAMVTALPAKAFLLGSSSVGRPLQHATVQVVREDGTACLPEETGQIQIRARSLCLGYHRLRSDISESGYLSADEGYLDHQGYLHVTGRSDRIIISGGEKIDPLEVEAAFLATGHVDQVLLTSWPDEEWGRRLVAFYIPVANDGGVDPLKQQLKARLVNYKIPRQIIPVTQLPLNAQGKPDHACMQRLIQESA